MYEGPTTQLIDVNHWSTDASDLFITVNICIEPVTILYDLIVTTHQWFYVYPILSLYFIYTYLYTKHASRKGYRRREMTQQVSFLIYMNCTFFDSKIIIFFTFRFGGSPDSVVDKVLYSDIVVTSSNYSHATALTFRLKTPGNVINALIPSAMG